MTTSPLSRRTFIAGAGATAAAVAGADTFIGAESAAAAIPGPTSYSASWASVDQHPPAPEWFQDAKFGIYYHWGAFSVPAYGNEWYPRRMYISGDACNSHHLSVYGDPTTTWGYNNFIDGKNNKAGQFVQFAPKLTSAGGNFDPNNWAQLFVDAGAKFAGPVAEHHDGFSMWNSKVNEWNSVGKGPKLDLLALHAAAIRAKGLKLVVAMHHAYHFTGYYDHVPPQSSATLKKLFAQQGSAAENQLWYDKLKEVVDQAQPDILWEDFNLTHVDENQRLNFLSYYYNQAVKWGKEVVATYKDGYDNKGEVYDYERGGPADIVTPYWLTDDSISSSSWCYTVGIGYYSTVQMLHSLIDRVSKNGNMLLNIAPMADGTIPTGQRTVLLGIGDYLKRFGESIYSTRAWTSFGEGPTKMGGGSFTTPRAGTSSDVRFTRSKDSKVLYATVLGWPGSSINIATLSSSRISLSSLTSVQLLGNTAGTYINLSSHTQDSNGLRISLPSQPYSALAYVIKLTFSSAIGGSGGGGGTFNSSSNYEIANVANGLALDSGGNVAAGTALKQYTWNGSTNLEWQVADLGNGYYRLINRTNGMAADSYGNATDGAQIAQAPVSSNNYNQQWAIADQGSGRYHITNRGTGKLIDNDGNTTSGSLVAQWTPNTSPNTLWTFTAR